MFCALSLWSHSYLAVSQMILCGRILLFLFGNYLHTFFTTFSFMTLHLMVVHQLLHSLPITLNTVRILCFHLYVYLKITSD